MPQSKHLPACHKVNTCQHATNEYIWPTERQLCIKCERKTSCYRLLIKLHIRDGTQTEIVVLLSLSCAHIFQTAQTQSGYHTELAVKQTLRKNSETSATFTCSIGLDVM